ncbi:MAG: SDR family NAD(P)-dependent oxidoreductase [Chloroflexota bacterium]
MKLAGKVALVTGGGYGIGKGIALELARAGADVAVAARSVDKINETAAEIRALGRRGIAVPMDVSKEKQVVEMVARTVKELGQIDILVNNAGIEGKSVNVSDMEVADWNEVLAVNLVGVAVACREALRHMVKRKTGVIINIGSGAGRRGFPLRSAYCASKWGLIGLTRTIAMEVGRHNIRCNCINPGAVEGERLTRVLEARSKATGIPMDEMWKRTMDRGPIRRLVKPEEIGATVVFLASDDGVSFTGQTLDVTAGSTMS